MFASYWLFFRFFHEFFLKDVNNSGAFYNFLSTNSDFKELFTEVRQIRYARADTVCLLTLYKSQCSNIRKNCNLKCGKSDSFPHIYLLHYFPIFRALRNYKFQDCSNFTRKKMQPSIISSVVHTTKKVIGI